MISASGRGPMPGQPAVRTRSAAPSHCQWQPAWTLSQAGQAMTLFGTFSCSAAPPLLSESVLSGSFGPFIRVS